MKIRAIISFIIFSMGVVKFELIEAKHESFKVSPRSIFGYEDCFKVDTNFEGNTFDAVQPSSLDVTFHLSTRNQPNIKKLSSNDILNLAELDFDVSRRTVFIVHGFASSADEPWVKNLTAAFLKREDVNAIAVDWKNGASFIRGYMISARNTRSTGKEISEFVSRIVDAAWKPNRTVAWGPMYLVGHSIGAHVSAFAANEIQKNNGPWDVTRITGLDPAGPCFDKVGEDMRLDSSDAPFVDVIHTNMATRATVGFGLSDQSGHMDFYVNGGARQPACQDQWMDLSCDHIMAYRYFIDSLGYYDGVTCSFFASKSNGNRYWSSIFKGPEDCNEKVEMGINAEKYKNKCSGSFDVATGKASPFCERTKKWYVHWQNPLYQLLGMASKMF